MLPDLKAHTIKPLLGNRDDARILEIGSSDGADTLEFLTAFPRGRVDCFECDPRAIALWKNRFPGNHPRATLYETALGEQSGRATFHQSGGRPPGAQWEGLDSWHWSGSLLAPDQHSVYEPWLTFPATIEVPVTTLDEWWTGEPIDFCWIDAQGAEAMILRGAQRVVPSIKWFYCECHSRPYYKGQATVGEIKKLLPGFAFRAEMVGDNFLFENLER